MYRIEVYHLYTRKKLRNPFGVSSGFEAKHIFYALDFNIGSTEITRFPSLKQLKYINENIKIRKSNYFKIEQTNEQNGDFIILNKGHIKTLSLFALPFFCKTPEIRKKYMGKSAGAVIETHPLISSIEQRQPFYNKYVNYLRKLPGPNYLNDSVFYYDNHSDLIETKIQVISNCLRGY